MLDKEVLSEITEILTPLELINLNSIHIEVHNGYAYGKVIFTCHNVELLDDLKADLEDVAEYSSKKESIEISTKSGRGAVMIASKIADNLRAKGIEVTESQKAFR